MEQQKLGLLDFQMIVLNLRLLKLIFNVVMFNSIHTSTFELPLRHIFQSPSDYLRNEDKGKQTNSCFIV